jgi:iron complex outermembrane receptor protein
MMDEERSTELRRAKSVNRSAQKSRQGRWTAMPRVAALLAISLLALPRASAQTATELADLSLEELGKVTVNVTSVSGYAQRLSDAAASIYVISAEDIRRSGYTTLPEALRLAPNLQVARVDAGGYAISARGFNNAIGNKLLVLIDGRTVYAPFFSGVLWDQQDVMLDNVERIEVISGPGGTLWGTNAVNGVINIVTRTAASTQGLSAVATGGNEDKDVSFRYGGRVGDAAHFRVFAKRSLLSDVDAASGPGQAGTWDRTTGGFRADWSDAKGGLMLQGNATRGRSDGRGAIGTTQIQPLTISESNLLGQWTRQLSEAADLRVRAYYDHSDRDDPLLYRPREDIWDVEIENGLRFESHRVLWGLGYRTSHDDLRPGLFFGFIPEKSTTSWSNLFAQDEVALRTNVVLTLGTRLEHNSFTGTEVLPSARLAWKLEDEQLLWAAASRAVRAPARLDRDIVLPPNPPFIIAGGPDFVSEVANVYELGYRAQATRDFSFSATGYYEVWNRLRSGQTPPNAQVQNMIYGDTSGIEAWATWAVSNQWRLSGGVTTLHKNLRLKTGSTDPDGPKNLGDDPADQWTLRSAFNLPLRQELDLLVRHIAALPSPAAAAYTAFDLRYGWRVNRTFALSLALRNMFDPRHAEFNGTLGRSEVGRNAVLQLRWTP